MLYEDRLGEPFKAVYHYREYLRQAPQSENRDLVQKWVTRAERTVLQQLMDQYPEDVAVLLGKAQSAVAGTTLTARELYLVQRLRKVNAELVALRQAQAPMDAAGSRASVGTVAAPAVLPSEPPVEEPPPTAEGPMPEPASEIVPAAGGSSGAMSPGVSPGGTAGQPGSGEVRGAGGSLTGQSGVSAGKAVSASPATAAAGGAVARVPPAPGKPFVPVRRLSSGGSAAASASENDRGQRGSYTVQKGDTLTSVAKKLCGTPSAWKRIQDANQDTLKGSANLRPGMVLRIPPRPAAGAGAKTP
jgi:nucleoid-associated protein YgaU